jgi:hypothetical protein
VTAASRRSSADFSRDSQSPYPGKQEGNQSLRFCFVPAMSSILLFYSNTYIGWLCFNQVQNEIPVLRSENSPKTVGPVLGLPPNKSTGNSLACSSLICFWDQPNRTNPRSEVTIHCVSLVPNAGEGAVKKPVDASRHKNIPQGGNELLSLTSTQYNAGVTAESFAL